MIVRLARSNLGNTSTKLFAACKAPAQMKRAWRTRTATSAFVAAVARGQTGRLETEGGSRRWCRRAGAAAGRTSQASPVWWAPAPACASASASPEPEDGSNGPVRRLQEGDGFAHGTGSELRVVRFAWCRALGRTASLALQAVGTRRPGPLAV